MKRADLVRHLTAHGCQLLREGGRHTIYRNPANRKTSGVPRHSEILEPLVARICKDLGIPKPEAKNERTAGAAEQSLQQARPGQDGASLLKAVFCGPSQSRSTWTR